MAVKTNDKKRDGQRIDDYATSRNEQQPAACRQEAAGSIACSCNRRETRLTGLSIFITSESCSFVSRGAVISREFIRCWIYMDGLEKRKKKRETRPREIKKVTRGAHPIYFIPISNLENEDPSSFNSRLVSSNGKRSIKRRGARWNRFKWIVES